MARTDSASSCAPQPNFQSPPPIAQVPRPMVVRWRPLAPRGRCRTEMGMSAIRRRCSARRAQPPRGRARVAASGRRRRGVGVAVVDDLAVDHRRDHHGVEEVRRRQLEQVGGEHDEIGQASRLQRAPLRVRAERIGRGGRERGERADDELAIDRRGVIRVGVGLGRGFGAGRRIGGRRRGARRVAGTSAPPTSACRPSRGSATISLPITRRTPSGSGNENGRIAGSRNRRPGRSPSPRCRPRLRRTRRPRAPRRDRRPRRSTSPAAASRR